MPCCLRVSGQELDVDRLLIVSGLDGDRTGVTVHRRGELVMPMTQPTGPRAKTSGISICVSDADFSDFSRQVDDVIEILRGDRELILALQSFAGVDDATLDFGINWRDVAVQCDVLPAELVKLAGELGLSIEISHYPVATDAGSTKSKGQTP